jgi:hypothetical protein
MAWESECKYGMRIKCRKAAGQGGGNKNFLVKNLWLLFGE